MSIQTGTLQYSEQSLHPNPEVFTQTMQDVVVNVPSFPHIIRETYDVNTYAINAKVILTIYNDAAHTQVLNTEIGWISAIVVDGGNNTGSPDNNFTTLYNNAYVDSGVDLSIGRCAIRADKSAWAGYNYNTLVFRAEVNRLNIFQPYDMFGARYFLSYGTAKSVGFPDNSNNWITASPSRARIGSDFPAYTAAPAARTLFTPDLYESGQLMLMSYMDDNIEHQNISATYYYKRSATEVLILVGEVEPYMSIGEPYKINIQNNNGAIDVFLTENTTFAPIYYYCKRIIHKSTFA